MGILVRIVALVISLMLAAFVLNVLFTLLAVIVGRRGGEPKDRD